MEEERFSDQTVLAELWDKTQRKKSNELLVNGALVCEKCKKYSVYSWKVEDWEQKYFCPYCQSDFFKKVNREEEKGEKESPWYRIKESGELDIPTGTPEKWKVAEKLMGRAHLIRKEKIIDELLISHIEQQVERQKVKEEAEKKHLIKSEEVLKTAFKSGVNGEIFKNVFQGWK